MALSQTEIIAQFLEEYSPKHDTVAKERYREDANYLLAQLSKPDEEREIIVAKELFNVWKEAKENYEDNWNDMTWEKLPQKHQEEYLLTARQLLSQLPSIQAREREARLEGIKEVVDWLNHHVDYVSYTKGNEMLRDCLENWKDWQAQLKEWGIALKGGN